MIVGALIVTSAVAQQVVEFPEGDVLASIRARSMGGAATGVAESASVHLLNPAAMAMGRPLAEPREVDADLTLQVRDHPLLNAALGIVLGLDPPAPPRRLAYWQIGANGRLGRLAGALHFRGHAWDTGRTQVGSSLWSAGGGYSGPTWAVGVLPHVLAFNRGARSALGLGTSVGGLWAPEHSPLRLGARLRTPIKTDEIAPTGIAASRLPAEAAIGGSWSIGAVNAAGTYGPEREQPDPGAPIVLVASDLVLTGGMGDAVALEPLIRNDRTRSSGPTASFRMGVEGQLLDQALRLRAGTYTRPSRGTGAGKIAGTAGAAYQVFEDNKGTRLRAAGVVEVAPGDFSWAVGFETW